MRGVELCLMRVLFWAASAHKDRVFRIIVYGAHIVLGNICGEEGAWSILCSDERFWFLARRQDQSNEFVNGG